jgi:hypothetical protein
LFLRYYTRGELHVKLWRSLVAVLIWLAALSRFLIILDGPRASALISLQGEYGARLRVVDNIRELSFVLDFYGYGHKFSVLKPLLVSIGETNKDRMPITLSSPRKHQFGFVREFFIAKSLNIFALTYAVKREESDISSFYVPKVRRVKGYPVSGIFQSLVRDSIYGNSWSVRYMQCIRGSTRSLFGRLCSAIHLTSLISSYEGIDGRCYERRPSRIFYGLLNVAIFLCLGLRISYRLIVKGDDCAYFRGFIDWHVLLSFSFLATAYGFGALVECVLYLTNPCDPIHIRNNVSQKYSTTAYCCNTVIDMANVFPIDKKICGNRALAKGSSIRSIERLTGIHRETIMRLGVRVGHGCEMLLDSKMQDLSRNYLQMDEVWGFVGKKERHRSVDDNPELGDVWTYCAIDSETKLVPLFKVGKRPLATTTEFVHDVASRMRNRVKSAPDAVRAAIVQEFRERDAEA